MSRAAAPERLAYLDGLRGVAVLAVLGFHYFSCFQSLVPWGGVWADFPFFRWGHWGVQLFFAISGFVILMTLERCQSLGEFALRRWARLWPTMLLCASLSYAVLTLVPNPWTPEPVDFLPSLTFIDGAIWNKLVPGLGADWIDVAYWSLFVEVRFYALAAVLWFLAPSRFTRNFYAFSTAVLVLYALLRVLGHAGPAEWLQWMFAAKFLPWFVLGVAVRAAARGDGSQTRHGLLLSALQTSLLLLLGDAHAQPVALVLVALLLLAPMRASLAARCLSARPLVAMGVASYSLYLLHQYAGLALSNAAAKGLGLRGADSLWLAFVMAVLLSGLARFIHRHWEEPMNGWLVRCLIQAGYRRPGRAKATRQA